MVSQVENNTATAEAYEASAKTEKKSKVSGKTIGTPELSEKGQKYYEQLKAKYRNMDFILVSEDMKERAKAQTGNYANANRMVVLIDEEKIERMAEDEEYRKQYEAIISNAATQLPKLQSSLGNTPGVKTYGIQVNDGGTASFFAVVDKSLAAQKERIAKKAAEKKEAAKKAEKKQAAKKAEEKQAEKKKKAKESEDEVLVTGSSIEDLLKNIQDTLFSARSDYIWSDEEKLVGQSFDIRS